MFNPLSYVKSSYAELTKVTWPSRATVLRHTLLVIIAIGVATLLVGLLDSGLTYLVRLLLERAP
jgi:preprotein translocase SecE subunit